MENTAFTVLLVDDEADILDFVGYNLRKEGYNVLTSDNGRDAIIKAKESIPHLILLDVMMPEMDGIETCREIKRIPGLENALVVFFTARSEDFTQILSLDAGGDDYITKPIKPAVLISKVNSLLRRHKSVKESANIYEAGDLRINKENYMVSSGEQEIQLARKEFELLNLLASRPHKVFTRDEIMSQVWDDDVIVGERTIDVHIRKIREKTGTNHIKTIKGVGYKFDPR
ncbi:MAG: response regulator transcription factor [Lentimicrobiaceae bacterium]|jgi:two-component system alkaline phosphatase synthesis response regulator PhoP